MVQSEARYSFHMQEKNSENYIVKIVLDNQHIKAIYKEALLSHKEEANTYGFSKGSTPLHYIEHTYKLHIIEHLKELFFTHCVMNFLCESLQNNRIVIAGEPKLIDVKLEPSQDAEFYFGLVKINNNLDDRWKNINFKVPGRKNYKDLDRQVEHFIKEETEYAKKNNPETINFGDLVCFEMEIVNKKNKPLLKGYKNKLWVKISNEEVDRELREIFLNKKIGDSFLTDDNFLQNYVSNELNMHYTFLIKIDHFLSDTFFSFDLFKHHFQIKTKKHLHQKLIEVFSYRNDISQRRETVELTLKHLMKQYFIPLPPQLLEQQKKSVLKKLHNNPDYIVYKSQSDFKERIKQLAEKQLKETIIIDAIAIEENIKIEEKDIHAYLNLDKRARTREFLYYKLPITKFNGQEIPIQNELIKQQCLREKTLNYVINHLTKKNKPK